MQPFSLSPRRISIYLAAGALCLWLLISWWPNQRLHNGILWRTLHPPLAESSSFQIAQVHKCDDMKCSQVMVEGRTGLFYLYGTSREPSPIRELVTLKINSLSQVFMCGMYDSWCMTVNVVCPGEKWPPRINGQQRCYRLFKNPWALTEGADAPSQWAPILGLPVLAG